MVPTDLPNFVLAMEMYYRKEVKVSLKSTTEVVGCIPSLEL